MTVRELIHALLHYEMRAQIVIIIPGKHIVLDLDRLNTGEIDVLDDGTEIPTVLLST